MGKREGDRLSRRTKLGLEDVTGAAETAVYHGGSPWAEYWRQTIVELREELIGSGELGGEAIENFLARCADASWWTETIAFTAVRARCAS